MRTLIGGILAGLSAPITLFMKLILGLLLALRLSSCGPLRVEYMTAPNSLACCLDCNPVVRLNSLDVLHYPNTVLAPVGIRVHNTSSLPMRVVPSLLRLKSNKLHYTLRHTTVTLAQQELTDQSVTLQAGDSCFVVAFFTDDTSRGKATDLQSYRAEEVVTLILREFTQQLGEACGVEEYQFVQQQNLVTK